MCSANALSIAQFCGSQYGSRSCALVGGIVLEYTPFYPVLEAFPGNLKIVRHGAGTENQHVHDFPDGHGGPSYQ